jgi:hypothetical protein
MDKTIAEKRKKLQNILLIAEKRNTLANTTNSQINNVNQGVGVEGMGWMYDF